MLFREEALRYALERGKGRVVVWHHPAAPWVANGLLLAVAAALLAVAFTPYRHTVVVRGFLEPVDGVRRVFAPAALEVGRVFVTEGQWVERGAPLISLVDERWLPSGRSERQERVQNLERELLQFDRMVHAEALRELSTRQSLRNEGLGLAQEANSLGRANKYEAHRQRLLDEEVTKLRALERRGLLASSDALTQQLAALDGAQRSEVGYARHLALQTALQRNVHSQRAALANWQLRRAELARQRLALARQLQEATAQQDRTVRAAVAGRVAFLNVFQGDRADPGSPMLSIAPAGAVRAVLLLDAITAPKVAPGQQVQLRFAGRSYQKHGFGQARVLNVSATPLLGHELVRLTANRGALYRAVAEVLQLPRGLSADRAGVEFEADVIVEERQVWAWLAGPLIEAMARL